MKEMVGGCCVCSDERGWAENPLVYCDGAGCSVAVHQACYGIVTVPSGPWYCRKCESQENAARVRCELCPSRDGALKKTDLSAWAHVVCALYIPEVRFGNVTTMEPIVLSQIPHERFNKTCYICDEAGKGSRASIGACMQCNKAGCKQQFHVTCAQSLGLLCEEAGNYLDNVKYCGYCQHHYSKLKKGGNVKTIPPYKPVNPDVSSDSSPEKELSDTSRPGPVKRKNSAKCSVVTTTSASKPSKVTEMLDSNKDNSNTSVTKFTTSNFVESVVTNSESVFGAEPPVPTAAPRPSPSSSSSAASHPANKKRKSGTRTPTLPGESDPSAVNSVSADTNRVIKTELVQPHESELTVVKIESHDKKAKVEVVSAPVPVIAEPVIVAPMKISVVPAPVIGQATTVVKSNVISSTGSAAPMPGIVVSVPLAAAPTSVLTTAPTIFQQLQQSIAANNINTAASAAASAVAPIVEPQPTKRRRSQSSEKPEKGRKNKRNCTPPNPTPAVITPTPPLPVPPKRSSRSNLSTPTPPPGPLAPTPLPMQQRTMSLQQQQQQPPAPPLVMKESPPSSPGSEAATMHTSRKNKKKTQREHRNEPKDMKIFSNGVTAPHMLGNQLNPSSNMSKKLSDALSDELEAHSVFTDSNPATSNLVGPQLHSRVIASVRSGAAAAAAANSANNPLSMGLGAAFAATAAGNPPGGGGMAAIPQSLDQLLERQWEQGSQFLMEQAQHFDIASLLSCLHQLRAENLRLEEHVNTLLQRRDHLLAVNARLAIPLTTQPPGQQVNNVHPEANPRGQRINNSYPSHPLENGLDNVLYPSPHRSPSTGSSGPTAAPGQGRSTSADNRRGSNAPSGYPTYGGVNASVAPQLSAATTQAIHAPRRDAVTDLHAMQSSKHS